MEILQLRYFYESAKNESFAKTAEKYFVPTSSVSASIKRLERELGCTLFERASNSIKLNENGKRFQKSVFVALNELDTAVLDLTTSPDDTREVKLLVRAMRSNITDIIIKYREKHPQVAFKTVFDFSEANFEDYDIIIDEKSSSYADFDSFELYTMRLRLMVSADSPLINSRHTLKDLSDMPFISIGEQSNMHKILINACHRAGFYPNIAVQSNDMKCFEKMVESGMGIGLGRERVLNLYDKIKYLDVLDFDEKYSVYAYYKHSENYGNVKHFLSFLKKNTH